MYVLRKIRKRVCILDDKVCILDDSSGITIILLETFCIDQSRFEPKIFFMQKPSIYKM